VREANYCMSSDDPSSVNQTASAAKARQATNQAALALELPFVVVGAIALGAVLGYFLDHWLHTKPILTFVFGGLGFIGGIRELIRRVGSGT
jgi:F0F1-type ATP synthase assembly protein I